MRKILFLTVLIFSKVYFSMAQYQTVAMEHYLLGVDVKGFEIDLPFSKDKTQESWSEYSKSFGKSETTNSHKTYQTIFRPDIYPQEVLIFSEIKGDKENSKLWVGIDPQGIPKDVYPDLLSAMEEFVYQFNIKMRTDFAQKKIDESEQAASYLSKEFESLKKEERKNQSNLEKANEKILSFEEKLKEIRTDSTQYVKKIKELEMSLDSLYQELEKVKSMVEVYKQQLQDIK